MVGSSNLLTPTGKRGSTISLSLFFLCMCLDVVVMGELDIIIELSDY